MKLLGISFNDSPADGLIEPSAVTVEMTKDEALLIAEVLGKMTGTAQNAVMSGGDEIGTDIYDCLVGCVFNRYWDDGVADALRER